MKMWLHDGENYEETLARKLAEAVEQRDRYREALAPFAEAGHLIETRVPDNFQRFFGWGVEVRREDLQRAAEALPRPQPRGTGGSPAAQPARDPGTSSPPPPPQ